MKKPVHKMTKTEIERELRSFAWNYIALADESPSPDEYSRRRAVLENRQEQLEKRLLELTEIGE